MGYIAGGLTANTLFASSITLSTSQPQQSGTSFNYTVGYEAIVQYNNQNVSVGSIPATLTQGPAVGGLSIAYSLGYGLGAENYSAAYVNVSDPSTLIVPPPATVTVTQTITSTYTYTSTVTIQDSSNYSVGVEGSKGDFTILPVKSTDVDKIVSGSSAGVAIIAIIIVLVLGFLLVLRR